MRDSSGDEGSGGEIVWLMDPGVDPAWAGPVAIDVTELEELVEGTFGELGQVAVRGYGGLRRSARR
jgi:hypothetical protein